MFPKGRREEEAEFSVLASESEAGERPVCYSVWSPMNKGKSSRDGKQHFFYSGALVSWLLWTVWPMNYDLEPSLAKGGRRVSLPFSCL